MARWLILSSFPMSSPAGGEGTMGLNQSVLRSRQKLTGRAFYESLGSPKMILAPMVDQSEFVGNSLKSSFHCVD